MKSRFLITRPLVCISGWSQFALEFSPKIATVKIIQQFLLLFQQFDLFGVTLESVTVSVSGLVAVATFYQRHNFTALISI